MKLTTRLALFDARPDLAAAWRELVAARHAAREANVPAGAATYDDLLRAQSAWRARNTEIDERYHAMRRAILNG